jgi:hypothetical protein
LILLIIYQLTIQTIPAFRIDALLSIIVFSRAKNIKARDLPDAGGAFNNRYCASLAS